MVERNQEPILAQYRIGLGPLVLMALGANVIAVIWTVSIWKRLIGIAQCWKHPPKVEPQSKVCVMH
jgi:hypothetical protein